MTQHTITFRPEVEDFQVELDELGDPHVFDVEGRKSGLDEMLASIDEAMKGEAPFGIFCLSELRKHLLLSAHQARVGLN